MSTSLSIKKSARKRALLLFARILNFPLILAGNA
nr:MAG TPA: hypothetical protein [Caudoviricetes sp.]